MTDFDFENAGNPEETADKVLSNLDSSFSSMFLSPEAENASEVSRKLVRELAEWTKEAGIKESDIPTLSTLRAEWMPTGEMLIFHKWFQGSLYVHPVFLVGNDPSREEPLPNGGGATTLRAHTALLERMEGKNNLFSTAVMGLVTQDGLLPKDAGVSGKIRICGSSVIGKTVPAIKTLVATALTEILNMYAYDHKAVVPGALRHDAFRNRSLVVTIGTDEARRDLYGKQTFSPIVITLSAKATANHGLSNGGGTTEIGKLFAYMDFVPLSPSERQAIEAKLPNGQVAPHHKPLLHITGCAFTDGRAAPSPSAVLALILSTTSIENTTILMDRVIQYGLKDTGSALYDYAAIGYWATNKKPFTAIRTAEYADFHQRVAHNKQVWGDLAVILDAPMDGPYGTAIRILGTDGGFTQALSVLTGKQFNSNLSVGSKSIRMPAGTYVRESDGAVRDASEITNLFSIATKFGGNLEAIYDDLRILINGYNPQVDTDIQDYNKVLTLIANKLVDNDSFKLTGEKHQILFNSGTLAAARSALESNNIQITFKDGASGLGNGLYFSNGAGNTGNVSLNF